MESGAVVAGEIARGEREVPEFKRFKPLIAELKGTWEFELARRVLKKAREAEWYPKNGVWVIQQLALCTYKDEELLPSTRFADALGLLEGIGLRDPDGIDRNRIDPKTLPETLALGGAVYKRKWEYEGQIENLHQALALYLAAWERDPREDMGYGGVNAAFVLDLLASRLRVLSLRSGGRLDESARLAARAKELRERMRDEIPRYAEDKKSSGEHPTIDQEYWYLVTLAETHFGLGEYEQAGDWLSRAARAPAPEWEQKTTWERQAIFRQLVSLARLKGIPLAGAASDQPEAKRVRAALKKFLGEETEPALSCVRGRVGLALSGGGFRASLFHIGALARLAEADVLRSVEVLSTVSGGSIVGAHYYLEVANLLRNKRDQDVTRDDYVLIVQRVMEQFLKGVQKNLRTRALSNLLANLKMAFVSAYSRSHRMGELYEAWLYACASDGHPAGEPRTMPQLLVKPADATGSEPYKPKFSNWKRRAKVPVLLLNATSLNSGHSWHFTARWMGEPPGLVGAEVDVNERYRRLWYEQAPTPKLSNYRLGWAVAASACVPGLFEPLVLEGLYPGRTVRLVDGGVHDNQGVAGLLNEGCTLILCSDASGQMADLKRPSNGVLGVPLRSNSILQSRVREIEYQDLKGRIDSQSLQGLLFIHLKKGLEVLPLDWIRCDDPTMPPAEYIETTPYGIDKDLQRKLSAIRTDLDSFTEVEAYALMLSGYLMTEYELKALDSKHRKDREPGSWGDFDVAAQRGDWPFLQLEHLMRQPPDSSDARRQDLGRQLEASASLALKIWKLSPVLKGAGLALAAAVLVGIGWLIRSHWDTQVEKTLSLSFNSIVLWIAVAALAAGFPIFRWLRPQEAMRGYMGKFLIAIGGWIFSNVHLWTFDRLYLLRGRLKRLMELK